MLADASRLLSSAVRCAKPKKKTYSSRRTLCSRPGLFFLPPVPFRTMPSERSSTVFRVWSSACGGQLHPALVRRRTHAMVLDRPRRSARRRACRLRSPSPPVVKNLQTSHCSNRPRRWVSATQEKKKTRDGRPLDVVLKSAGPCPFGPPSSCRCRAALPSLPSLLGMFFTVLSGSTGDRATSIEGSRGAESKKNVALVFGGGGVGCKKKEKKDGFSTLPENGRPRRKPQSRRETRGPFRNNFSGKLSEGSKHSQGDSQGG